MTTRITTLRDQSARLTLPFTISDAVLGLLAFLTLLGLVAGIGRLWLGLGATTNLTDGSPWGLWIGFDFSLIAFAGAGFTLTAMVHILHLERCQPALRPAVMAGLMGYSAVLLLLVLDLGRPDRFYHFILFWNVHSPLFEISWCVLLYTTILVIEVSPLLAQRLQWTWLRRLTDRIMVPVAILGVTFSTLHQSTLGTLYLNMPHRLDRLWYTPMLPLLFFVSAVMAGLALAMVAYRIAAQIQGERPRAEVISGLGQGLVYVALLYLALKGADLLLSGDLAAFFSGDPMSRRLMVELLLGAVLPVILWLIPVIRTHPLGQWGSPSLVLTGVLLNRFNATLFAQKLPVGTIYDPHILEWLSTIGILAGAALIWYLGVRWLRPTPQLENEQG